MNQGIKQSPVFRWAIILIGVAALVIAGMTPCPDGLSWTGKMSLVIFLVGIVFWIAEVMPIAVSAWMLVALVPLLGILPATDTWTGAINNSIVFYLCCFAFSVFFAKSTLATRMTALVLKWAGTNSHKVLLGFMVCTAVISMFVDNLPLTAVMLPIAYAVLDANDTPTGRKSGFAKCIAIGIPWAAAIGGAMTPAGCIMNVLAISLIQEAFGVTISFVQWMAMGIPLAVITIPAAWFALCKIFKPENLTDQAVAKGIERGTTLGAVPLREKAGLAVILVTVVVWILGSWIPVLDTTVVSLIALGVMFFPKIEAITFDDFLADSPWGMMLLMMAVCSLVTALTATGATEWLVAVVMQPLTALPLVVVLAVLSIIGCLLHNVIPAGPACAGLIVVPFCSLVAGMGGSIAATAAMAAWWSAIALMLPLDGVPLLSYSSKRQYFTFGDMLKSGWAPSLVMVLITVFLTPAIAGLIGLP